VLRSQYRLLRHLLFVSMMLPGEYNQSGSHRRPLPTTITLLGFSIMILNSLVASREHFENKHGLRMQVVAARYHMQRNVGVKVSHTS